MLQGHCVLRARDQCEWLTFIDIDEFAYARQKDGRLDTILDVLGTDMSYIGGLEVQMISMGHSETQLIRKPEGGVVRNYQCRMKATNVKSIVRPDVVHHSLYSGVHFFCYKEGYVKKTLRSTMNPVLFHYSVSLTTPATYVCRFLLPGGF